MINIESKLYKLLSLLVLCLLLGGIFVSLGSALLSFFYDSSTTEILSLSQNPEETGKVKLLKYLQLFNSFGLFILPAILYIFLFEGGNSFLSHQRKSNVISFLITLLIFFSFLPILNLLVSWNASLELPESLKAVEEWMRASEDKARQLTEAFLQMESREDLIFNLFLIAVLPAIGEELIFRACIQNTINKGRKTPHLGIWISAVLFSAIHFQFFGFFPRMLLGALFGYLLTWSGNIWIPIFAHFINNGFAVLVVYISGADSLEKQMESTSKESFWLVIISSILFLSLLWTFRQTHLTKSNQ